MHERLSFYIKRDSLLHRANPLTKLVMVFAFILLSYAIKQPWLPSTLIIGVVVLAFVGKVQREFFNVAMKMVFPAAGFLFVMQALFIPGGKTLLVELWFLHLYSEALQLAFVNATRIFMLVTSFLLFILSTHPSELMTDLTRRGLPGQLAYVVVSTLQILPQMQAKAAAIISAQRSRGLDTEGSLAKRVGALGPLVGPLVFGSLVEVEERAIAIEARAFMSTLKKTSLKEVADTRLDKALRITLIAITVGAFLWR
jgi:energy-coupling factor transport system permease protein